MEQTPSGAAMPPVAPMAPVPPTPVAPAASTLSGLEGFFDTYLNIKAPFHLPAGAKEWIVKYGPWISLVALILGAIVLIPLLMLALGLTAISFPFAGMYGGVGLNLWSWIHIIIGIVALVMEGIAIPALMKRQLSGWHLVYYATLLTVVSSIFSVQIVSAILSLVIGMYFLFQIRSYYK